MPCGGIGAACCAYRPGLSPLLICVVVDGARARDQAGDDQPLWNGRSIERLLSYPLVAETAAGAVFAAAAAFRSMSVRPLVRVRTPVAAWPRPAVRLSVPSVFF